MSNKNSNWKQYAFAMTAGLVATIATASAQGVTMKAAIPFAFSINRNANLPAGNYVVTRDRSSWVFRSEDTHQAVLIATAIQRTGQYAEKPSLIFDCVGEHCQLRAIHMGGGGLGADLPAPKLNRSGFEKLTVLSVDLEPGRGE
jgi:hypothetical protein